jgi:hypothetical protein
MLASAYLQLGRAIESLPVVEYILVSSDPNSELARGRNRVVDVYACTGYKVKFENLAQSAWAAARAKRPVAVRKGIPSERQHRYKG